MGLGGDNDPVSDNWSVGIRIHGGNGGDRRSQRGSYLVNTIMTCGNCHTPKGPPAAVAGKDFSGGLSWDEPPFKVTAPNITPDKDTGIGKWSAADIKKAAAAPACARTACCSRR